MAVTHQDLFQHAKNLLEGESECAWRNSAGRAYYAAFHRGQVAAKDCIDPNENMQIGSHSRLSEKYRNYPTMQAKSIAYILQGMKKTRNIADYQLTASFGKDEAQSQIETCDVLLGKLSQFELSLRTKEA